MHFLMEALNAKAWQVYDAEKDDFDQIQEIAIL
jgi:hypothetical protein